MHPEIKTFLQVGKCENCKSGKFSKCCQKRKTRDWVEFANHKRRYFCNPACAILFLDQKYPEAKVFEQIYHGFCVGGLKQ